MPRLIHLPLLALLACKGGEKGTDPVVHEGEGEGEGDTPAAEPVCALPTGLVEVGSGDANDDGRVDVSDSVWMLRYVLNGGTAPACEDASDVLRDNLLDIGDGLALLYHLFTGSGDLPAGSRLDCPAVTMPEVPCGLLSLSLSAPEPVSGAAGATVTAEVPVLLSSPDLDVQAWSFGVTAEGCTITGAREEGTAIADTRLDEAGHRDDGFTRSDVVSAGLTHGALLSWKRDVVLSARVEAWTVLKLDISATTPSSGCSPCTLSLPDALAGAGVDVLPVVSAGGRSYTPDRGSLSFDVCAE